jgi:hypothetical protein
LRHGERLQKQQAGGVSLQGRQGENLFTSDATSLGCPSFRLTLMEEVFPTSTVTDGTTAFVKPVAVTARE